MLYASFRLGCLNGFRCVMKCSEKIHTYLVRCSTLSNKNGQKIEKFHGCANIVCRLAHLRRYGSSLQPTTVASEPADWTNRSTVCCGRELLYFRVNVIEKKKKKWKKKLFCKFLFKRNVRELCRLLEKLKIKEKLMKIYERRIVLEWIDELYDYPRWYNWTRTMIDLLNDVKTFCKCFDFLLTFMGSFPSELVKMFSCQNDQKLIC